MTEEELWREMAQDPEMQGLRTFANGKSAFEDDEFIALLKAVMPTFLDGEDDDASLEASLEEINKCFGILKLYRLHEAMLESIIRGLFRVTGVDKSQPSALLLEEVEGDRTTS